MSQAPNDLTFNVKAATDVPSIQSAAREAKEQFEREFGGIRGQLEGINDIFGRSSTFGHVLHAAEGGGALFGIGMLGRELSEGSEKLKDLVEKFHEGKINGGEMVDEIAKGLPLIGNFYSATRNIVDLMSGEADLQKRITESAKEAADFRKQEFESMQKGIELHKEFTSAIIAAQNAAANVYLEGPSRSIATAQQAIDERHRTSADALKDALKKAGIPELTTDIANRHQAIAQLKKELDAADADVARQEEANRAAYGVSYNPNDPRQHANDAKLIERAESLRKQYEILNGEQDSQEKRRRALEKQTTDDFNAEMLKKDDAAQKEITKLREDQQKQRESMLLASEKRINDTLAHARAAGLSEERQQYEAHLIELKQALSDSLADLSRKTRDQVQKDLRDSTFSPFSRAGQAGQDIFTALREASADYQNFSAQSGASKRQFDEQERLKSQEREGQIAKANLDILRAQADVGDRTAKLEIEKLEAAQKYRDLQRELLGIMNNPAMSGDARSEASRQLGLLPFLAMQTISQIRDHRTPPSSLAGLQTVFGAGGIGLAAAEGSDREHMQLASANNPQQQMAKNMQDIADQLKKLFNGTFAKSVADELKNALSLLGYSGNLPDDDGSGSNYF